MTWWKKEQTGCMIKEIKGILLGVGGTKRKLYEVHHLLSNIYLHAISLNEALTIAKLLQLEYRIENIQEEFFPCDYDRG